MHQTRNNLDIYVHEDRICEHPVIWYAHKINFGGAVFDIYVHAIHKNAAQTNIGKSLLMLRSTNEQYRYNELFSSKMLKTILGGLYNKHIILKSAKRNEPQCQKPT